MQQAELSNLYPNIQKGEKDARKQIFRWKGQDENIFQVRSIFNYFFNLYTTPNCNTQEMDLQGTSKCRWYSLSLCKKETVKK